MPRLNDGTMETRNLPGGNYGFSAVKIDNLGASEYTLVHIVQDVSPSVSPFKKEMEDCLQEIIKACMTSPRADNLLIRFVQFGGKIKESHGFKMLEYCNPGDYRGALRIMNATALYDAVDNAIESTGVYAKDLFNNDFSANAIVIVITDGWDNASTTGPGTVRKKLAQLVKEETLESLVTILVGVGMRESGVAKKLKDFQNDAGLTRFLGIEKADAPSLGKLADFVSKSIQAQSQALGTGGPSQPISLVI